MRLVISHSSALDTCSQIAASGKKLARPSALRTLKGCLCTERDFRSCDLSFLPFEVMRPLDVLVPSVENRCATTNLRCHTWCAALPNGSFYQLSSDVYIASPELSLLMMSKSVSFNELVLLCSEACSCYACDESERGFYDRPALTTVAKIAAYLDKVESASGLEKLRRALRYAVENSHSPMETAVGILIGMPPRLGGFGLPRPQLNCRLNLDEETRRMASRQYVMLDFYFPEQGVAIEYDSFRYHLAADQMASDMQRNNTLRFADIPVINLTWAQVRNPRAFEDAMVQVASALGKALREPSEVGRANRVKLRADVLPSVEVR